MKHTFFTAHSRLTACFLCLIVNMGFGQPSSEQPCGNIAESSDYQAVFDFLNTGIHVAGNLPSEIQVPLHIIYVNGDAGTPPQHSTRISTMINISNQIWDGIANFYICGYHHVNNSNFTNFDWFSDRVPMYDLYHMDEALNIYIVQNSGLNGGQAAYPWAVKNNMIVLNQSANEYILAHEIGHSFGLFHTFQGNNPAIGTGFCTLLDPNSDPSSTGDLIEDTPVDPGSICPDPPGCPTATSSCTPNCTFNGLTYTYTGFWTNNIMSYYRFCFPLQLTDDQKDHAKDYLMNHAGLAFLRNGIEPNCNNDISEVGFVNRYCQYFTPNPDVSPIKDIQVDMRNEVTGWEGSTKKTKSDGDYLFYSNDYSNLSYVTINPKKSHPFIDLILVDPTAVPLNYHPKNGCDMADVIRTGKHILNGNFLEPPYSYIAADVNTSGSITTFDVHSMRKVAILMVDPALDFPSGTWHFVPEYYFNNTSFASEFEALPFTATYAGLTYPQYMDEVVLDMDDISSADPNTWSFRAIKMGDVNCSMIEDGLTPPSGGGESLVTVGSAGFICVQNNDVITIEVKGNANQALVGYQMGMQYNQNTLQFLGSSGGNLRDYTPDNFAASNGEIRALWNRNDFQAESITTQKTFTDYPHIVQ